MTKDHCKGLTMLCQDCTASHSSSYRQQPMLAFEYDYANLTLEVLVAMLPNMTA